MAVVIAVDAGTTGVRSLAVDERGTVAGWSYREFPQYFPQPGWVEQDAELIWSAQLTTTRKVLEKSGVAVRDVAAMGITNQRETTIVWERTTGRPIALAIVSIGTEA